MRDDSSHCNAVKADNMRLRGPTSRAINDFSREEGVKSVEYDIAAKQISREIRQSRRHRLSTGRPKADKFRQPPSPLYCMLSVEWACVMWILFLS